MEKGKLYNLTKDLIHFIFADYVKTLMDRQTTQN